MSKIKMRTKVISALLAVIFTQAPLQTTFAQGHLQNWNNNEHERSQRLLSAAMTNLNKGFLDKATTLLLEATQADPSNAAPAAALGLAYVRQGKYGEALDVLKKAYQLEKSAETLLTTGFAYYLQHDYDAAIASWTKALERDNRIAEINGDIAFAYLRKGDFVKADEYFRQLIKQRTGSQFAYHGLAVLNYLAGNLTASRRAAEHSETIRSYYPVLLLLAKLDYLQGDSAAGQKHLSAWQRASSNKKTLLRPMTAIGYPSQRDFNWDPFLQDNFDNGKMLSARASQKIVRSADGKLKQAKTPGSGKGDLSSAVKQAVASAPKDFYLLREQALIEMATGDINAASDHFHEVLQLCPSSSIDWLHYARALALQDKGSEASYAVREFQRTHPNEKIANSIKNLAAGAPSAIPDMNTQSTENKPKRNDDDSGF